MLMVMLMIVMAAAAMLAVLMVMLVVVMAAAAMLAVLMMMLVIVVTAAAMLTMLVVMMGMLQLRQILCQGCVALHGLQQLLAGQFAPGGGDDGGGGIMLPQQGHGLVQLGLGNGIGAGEDDGGSGLHLVVVELTEVLHIDLDLAGIHNGHGEAQGHILIHDLLHGSDHIGQLAHTGGLNDDAVGVILLDDLGQGLAEVAYQGAANAAGVHLGNVDARILEETAVDADLAELIFNEHQLLAGVGFLDHLLDQSGLAGTEEAGINIDFCHRNTFCT